MKSSQSPMRLTGSVINSSNLAIEIADDGSFDETVFPDLNDVARAFIVDASRSVCRIRLDLSDPEVGTGFVVGPGLIATNKHVAEKLYETNFGELSLAMPGFVSFEADGSFGTKWAIGEAICIGFPIHFTGNAAQLPAWDIAIFRVPEAATAGRTPLKFAVSGVSPTSRNVAAIGFPSKFDGDGSGTSAEEKALGGKTFAPVKRVSPGVLGNYPEHQVFGFRHTCSTLPGSSGSPIIDLDSGLVLAVHYFGDDQVQSVDGIRSNWAVPANRLSALIDECNRRLNMPGDKPILTGALKAIKPSDKKWTSDFFGVLPDPPDFRDLDYRPSLVALPDHKLLSDAYPPEVLDQGEEPSCTAFALAHLLAILQFKSKNDPKISTRMAYEMARLHDDVVGRQTAGSTLRGVIKGFFHNGIATLNATEKKEWGRGKKDWTLTYDIAKNARGLSLGAYYRLMPKIADYHSAIAETGAILVSAQVHKGWETPQDGRIAFSSQPATANHAFVIVGYDSEGFIVLNSFGPKWNSWEKAPGRAHWSYEDWAENIIDGWVLRPAVSAPNAFGKTAKAAFWGDQGTAKAEKNPMPRRAEIIGHLIATERGDLLDYGRFASDLATLNETARIFGNKTDDGQPKYKHLLLVAHSELTREEAAQSWTFATKQFFKQNKIYPISILIEPAYAIAFRNHFDGVIAEAKKRLPETALGFADLVTSRLKVFGPKIWKSHSEAVQYAFRKNSTTHKGIMSLIGSAIEARLEIHVAGHLRGALIVEKMLEVINQGFKDPPPVSSIQLLGAALGHLASGRTHSTLTRRTDFVFKSTSSKRGQVLELKNFWLELVSASFLDEEGFVVGLESAARAFRAGPSCQVKVVSELAAHGLSQLNCCANPQILNAIVANILGDNAQKNQLDERSLYALDFDA